MDNDNYEDDDIDDLNVWPFFSSMSYMPGWWMNAFTEKKNLLVDVPLSIS